MKNRAFLTIFLIVFIDLLGYGIILPLLPFIAEKFGANPFQIGLLAATYSFFQLFATPIIGRLSDRYGRRKLLIFSQIGSAFGFLLLGTAGTLPLLFLSRVIDGTTGGNISVAQAYIADITTKENRAKGMGMIGAAFGLGFIFGPALGGFLYQFGDFVPAILASFLSLVSVFATFFFLKETVDVERAEKSPRTKFSFLELIKTLKTPTLGIIIIAFFLLNLAFSVMQGNFALWTQNEFNFGPSQNGGLFAYIGILAVVIQLKVLPKLIKKFREIPLLKHSVFLLFLGLILLPIFKVTAILFISLGLISLGNGISGPTFQSIASEDVPREDYGGVLGLLQSAGSFGRILGPAIGGEIFYAVNADASMYFAGFVVFLTYLMLLLKLKDEKINGQNAITSGIKVIPQ